MRDSIARFASRPLRRLRPSAATGQSSATERHFWALRDVEFDVARGEVVGIIGRNGAGKSTLLKILSRITKPTSGFVDIYGRVGSLLEVGSGFHPELTGRENIFLNGAILGMTRADIIRRFDEIVSFAEVDDFVDTAVKKYSTGMYLRLAFAVAAHLEPEILIVDEVLAVGDAQFQRKCLGRMNELSHQHGRTILFVSHNMGAIQQICSRAVLLEHGAIREDGPAPEVTQAYLSLGLSTESQRVWHDAELAPGDTFIRLRAVSVRDNNGELRAAFTVRDPIAIRIDYQVLRACHAAVFIELFNEEGVCVFSSIDNNDSPWRNGECSAGTYASECRIPADFLNSGHYSVVVAISEFLGKAVMHAVQRDAVSFGVSDSADPRGVRGNFTYTWPTSAIRPRLQWSVTRTSQDVAAASK